MKRTKTRKRAVKRSDDIRQQLLLVGMEAFADKGYYGTGVRDITGKIGCSVNALSVNFGGKEGLADAIIDEFKRTIVLPVAQRRESIPSDLAWRVAVKSFVTQVIGLFNTKEVPNRYFAALYRHESARLHDKKRTLHKEIIEPVFHELEKLMALGVAEHDPVTARLWTLALWNNVVIYALKHPDVLKSDVPAGMDGELFRAMTIDFMVDKCIRDLKFTGGEEKLSKE